jgi:hypothetical protein
MAKKVFALDTKPGVQRDGTVFDKQVYNDGRWVRFSAVVRERSAGTAKSSMTSLGHHEGFI